MSLVWFLSSKPEPPRKCSWRISENVTTCVKHVTQQLSHTFLERVSDEAKKAKIFQFYFHFFYPFFLSINPSRAAKKLFPGNFGKRHNTCETCDATIESHLARTSFRLSQNIPILFSLFLPLFFFLSIIAQCQVFNHSRRLTDPVKHGLVGKNSFLNKLF